MNQDTPRNLREELQALSKAIAESRCAYCGAEPNTRCMTKPKTPFRVPVGTSAHHMDRVMAGHALLKLRSNNGKA